jgi:hypothetical protein
VNLSYIWRTYIYDVLAGNGWWIVAPDGVYLRLFAADPFADGPELEPSFDDEAAGGSYTGQPLPMTETTPGTGVNTDPVVFANMPAGTWTHWGLATTPGDSFPGTLIATGALTSARTTAAGSSLTLAAGDFGFSIT